MIPKDIAAQLQPLIGAEAAARYFYEAARTWARDKGYDGAERQFGCFAHYHKHNLKMTLNLFADFDQQPDYTDVIKPQAYILGLPDAINDAVAVETELVTKWNAVTHDSFDADQNVYGAVKKIQKRAQKWFYEMSEYAEKLKLFNTGNPLDLVYFDRKILRW